MRPRLPKIFRRDSFGPLEALQTSTHQLTSTLSSLLYSLIRLSNLTVLNGRHLQTLQQTHVISKAHRRHRSLPPTHCPQSPILHIPDHGIRDQEARCRRSRPDGTNPPNQLEPSTNSLPGSRHSHRRRPPGRRSRHPSRQRPILPRQRPRLRRKTPRQRRLQK
jgi:hypothetical protein